MTKQRKILQQAEKAALSAKSWADFSNFLYAIDDGIVTKAYPTAEDRASFKKTPEHRRIRALLGELMNKFGLIEGATPKKSGRFVLRLPRSLHYALEKQAIREGVSLNQLAVAKLAIGMPDTVFGKSA